MKAAFTFEKTLDEYEKFLTVLAGTSAVLIAWIVEEVLPV